MLIQYPYTNKITYNNMSTVAHASVEMKKMSTSDESDICNDTHIINIGDSHHVLLSHCSRNVIYTRDHPITLNSIGLP